MEVFLCPTCGGYGMQKGERCPGCKGEARLASFGPFVLFWSKPITSAGILERRAESFARRVLFFGLALVGLLGIAALAYEIIRSGDADLFSQKFWLRPSARLFFFYVTIWTDAYLVAKILREQDRFRPVERKKYAASAHPPAKDWEEARRVLGRNRLDVARALNPEAFRVLEQAFELARKEGHDEAGNAHIFTALLPTRDVRFLFARLNIGEEQLRERVRGLLAQESKDGVTHAGTEFWNTVFSSYGIAFETRAHLVRPLELFLAIARAPGKVQEMLFDLGVEEKEIENVTAWVRIAAEIRAEHGHARARAALRPRSGMNRAMTAVATPALDRLSEDYTLRAVYGQLPPFINREKEFEAFFRILDGGGRSVLLVGSPGTGKEAFLEGLALRMAAEDVPSVLTDMRLVVLSLPKLIAGATPAEVAERLERVFYEAAMSRNIILGIPAVEGLVGITTGASGGIDLAEILASNISKLRIPAIATTTPEGYAALLERTSIGQNFEKLDLAEVDPDGAIQICEAKAIAIEAEQRVWFSYDAIEQAVTLSDRYMHDRFLPEKAIELIREVAYAVRSARGEGAVVGPEDVAALVSEKAKVPVTAVTETEKDKLLGLEERMHERVIGQEEAVTAVARAIRRARTELRAPNRPIANFLFLGPTGVGKTELAKTLAATYFGNEEAMVRLDMSEYQDQTSIHRLIGMPGSAEGGVLTEAVRRQPFALVLLDEIEKAHPDILNVFLQVMDDGRLTDSTGRTADFTNVILIATSNAASQYVQDAIGAGTTIEEIQKQLLERELKSVFRPEFLNRFDSVIVFRPLTPEDVEKIARIMLIAVAKQLEEKQIGLQATDDAVLELATAGFDPVYGARPLRRLIQERVQDLLASELLKGKIGRRDTVILEKGGTYRVERR